MSETTRPPDHARSEFETDWALAATERAGPAIVDRRRRRVVRLILFVMLLAGTGWLWREGRLEGVVPAVQQAAQLLSSVASQRSHPAGAERAEAPPPIETREVASRPESPPPPPASERTPDPAPATPPAAAERVAAGPDAAATRPEPLPAVAPATDALGRRAEAAGLHPELSRVLLARLSDEDYRNAAAAIRTALAETTDEATLEWPAKATTRQARFRVLFVVGAPDRCRRYVVEIAKDGWLTTAPPMERCGIARPAGRAHSRPPLRQG